MKFWKFTLVGFVLILSSSANAALVSRLGGLAYYDTEADLTWLADANYSNTTGYATALYGFSNNGRLNWADANNWAAALNITGVTGWRLPDTLQPDPSCDQQVFESHGFNCTGSELGNLFYNVLGGVAGSSIADVHNSNYDLFVNIQSDSFNNYWSATDWSVIDEPSDWGAYGLNFNNGGSGSGDKTFFEFAWAVHSGDVSAVPVPAAVWLFGSGLIGLVGFARRKK